MRTHNMEFYEDLTKIIFQLSNSIHIVSVLKQIYIRDFPAFQNLGPGALDFGKK